MFKLDLEKAEESLFSWASKSLQLVTAAMKLKGTVVQTVKNLPAMKKTRVQSLGQEEPLEKGMAIHSNILTWRIPGTEEPGGLQSMGSQRVRHY